MALPRLHKGMKMAAGFLTVIPANAGIQGERDEDGFPPRIVSIRCIGVRGKLSRE